MKAVKTVMMKAVKKVASMVVKLVVLSEWWMVEMTAELSEN